jgi:pyridoxamine 5'-phosphate oxidase family protein
MKAFSEAELAYLRGERRLARVATADAAGRPQVTPIGMWRYNADLGTIDISGRNFSATRKYRNVSANPQAAFVVDDIASVSPWRPRAVIAEGPAQAVPDDGTGRGPLIRIAPDRIISWGLDDGAPHAET